MHIATAREEWAAFWPVAPSAMLGISSCAIFSYSSGVFLGPMTAALGWSRATFSSGFTVQMLAMLVFMPLVGRLVERIGPRRVVLTGLVPAAVGLSLLGLAGHSVWLWWGLCLVQAACGAMISPTPWLSGVTRCFDRSRGLALAIALSGLGIIIAVGPLMGVFAIQHVGWRLAFGAIALFWLVILMPLTLVAFRPGDARSSADRPVAREKFRLGPALASRTFLCVAGGGGIFGAVIYGLIVHLVPVLRGEGISLARAASIAGLTGLCSIAGRLGTGYLLDRVPTRALSVVVFLVPAGVSLLLWSGSTKLAIVAVVLLGLSTGAELDVLSYITSRRFGHEGFASVYSVISAILGVGASMGPLVASALFDARQSYAPFFALTIPVVVVAAMLIGLVPPANAPAAAIDI